MKFIIVKTRVVGLHYWPGGQPDFLQNPHRHEFHIEAMIEVWMNDRELEFITVKSEIDKYFSGFNPVKHHLHHTYDFGRRSCEQLAEELSEHLSALYPVPEPQSNLRDKIRRIKITVLEDGENGAVVGNF